MALQRPTEARPGFRFAQSGLRRWIELNHGLRWPAFRPVT